MKVTYLRFDKLDIASFLHYGSAMSPISILWIFLFSLGAVADSAFVCEGYLTAPRMWREIDPAFQARSRKVFKSYPNIYMRARSHPSRISNSDDPFLLDMEQSYGFRFEDPIFVPAFESTMAQITGEIQQQLDSGNYSRDDLFLPARVFQTPAGEIVPVADGMLIPQGALPHNGSLTGRRYKKIVMQGYQVIGLSDAPLNYGQYSTFTMHDFIHLWIFRKYPNFAKSLRSALRNVEVNGGWDIMKSKEWSTRFLDLIESSEVVRPEAWSLIQDFVSLPPRPEGYLYNIEEIETVLRAQLHPRNTTLSERRTKVRRIKTELAQLRKLFNRYVVSYGGSAADPAARYTTGRDFRYSGGGILSSLLHSTTQLFSGVAEFGIVRNDMIASLAQLYCILANLRWLSIEEWTQQGLQASVDPNSKFYLVFCASEIFRNAPGRELYCGF